MFSYTAHTHTHTHACMYVCVMMYLFCISVFIYVHRKVCPAAIRSIMHMASRTVASHILIHFHDHHHHHEQQQQVCVCLHHPVCNLPLIPAEVILALSAETSVRMQLVTAACPALARDGCLLCLAWVGGQRLDASRHAELLVYVVSLAGLSILCVQCAGANEILVGGTCQVCGWYSRVT